MSNRMKLFVCLALLLLPCAFAGAETLEAYPVPEGTPCEDVYFSVTADGREVGVYSDYNGEFNEVNFAYFNFTPGMNVEVKIDVGFKFRKVTILPERKDLRYTVEGSVITLTADNPGDDYTFVFNDDYEDITLHLFTNPVDPEEEAIKSAFTTLYYGPGYHDLSDGQLTLRSGMTLYVAAGAVINAPVVVENAKNVKILGTGVIMMDKKNAVNPQYGNIVITLNHASDVYIGSVIAHAHRTQNWTTHVYFSSDVLIEGYHVVSTQYASVDALDITNSQRVTVRDCFLRSCDDCITIKGLASVSEPSKAPANEGIHVSGCQLWNDCNNAMVVGEESMAAYYDDISFRDIDVLYSYDDRDNHEKLNERAVMSIVTLHGTHIRNIVWEDIRVNNCQRLVCMRFCDSFWFGSIQGNQSFPGGINGVTFKNVVCASDNKSKIANQILLEGYGRDKLIQNVAFEQFVIGGKPLTSLMSPHITINEYVRGITFR